jgi:hypothetical protein
MYKLALHKHKSLGQELYRCNASGSTKKCGTTIIFQK